MTHIRFMCEQLDWKSELGQQHRGVGASRFAIRSLSSIHRISRALKVQINAHSRFREKFFELRLAT
jgi:hypothetical protein